MLTEKNLQQLMVDAIECDKLGVFARTPVSAAGLLSVATGTADSGSRVRRAGGRVGRVIRYGLPLAACVGLWFGVGEMVFDGSPTAVPMTKVLESGNGSALVNGASKCHDLSIFDGCMTGPESGSLSGECSCVDFDRDGDVDFVDFGYLQRQVSPQRG